ncbi:methyl-accepting chemotaxis protein [Nitratidesulfovibrio sp. HK-II]|uniref:methyl-accepting chemotaxis protein n=1 Tax=Nitratidesulfovibrio sp. HK-II TaxID=2009266 RepID=UPI000E2FCF55|nr:methyl-accepting chemotaxis protein [Nitratidesulfovibrio sp. HK-II]GBO95137.1 methyl-accepting chemotaxis protein [Nitratidesulfovibrio sp. HK-II]
MGIKTRLYLLLASVLVALAAIVAASWVGSAKVEHALELRALAVDANTELLQARRQEKNFLMRKEQQWADKTRKHIATVDSLLKRIAAADPGNAAMCDKGRSTLSRYNASLDEVFRVVAETDAMIQAGRAVEPALADIRKAYEDKADELSDLVKTVNTVIEMGMGVLITLFVLAVISGITRSLAVLQAFSREVAAGRLDATAQGNLPGEFGLLRDDLAAMVDRLKETLTDSAAKGDEARHQAEQARAAMDAATAREQEVSALVETMRRVAGEAAAIAGDLTDASQELAAQTQQVSAGAEVQRARMAETATAMDQMNATVMEIARNATLAADASKSTREEAQKGAQVVQTAGQSISRVHEIATRLRADMQSLGRDAESIGEVINVINEIADQTNLLALNAAIEAARAGDAGRGFAVVADEVRKLAEKTTNATKEVETRISAIQTAAQRNVGNMDTATQAVADATGLAEESGGALRRIVEFADNTAGQVQSIAAASEEQSAASDQISRAVTEVNDVAAESARGMEAASEAVRALALMAERLRAIIQQMGSGQR